MTRADTALLHVRVNALTALYRHIAATRMEGIPLLNPKIQVQAVGFEAVASVAALDTDEADSAPAAAVGVLITPWFMNLIWLPLEPQNQSDAVGCKLPRYVGPECFEFIGAYENDFGSYASCSLFSPVFEFGSHQAALDTARAVLDTLRQPVPTPLAPTTIPGTATAHAAPVPARRAFLFGRNSGASAVPTTHATGQRHEGSRHG